jgi:death on curing protein
VTVTYLDLADFVEIAAEVTGLEVTTIVAMANLDLAYSALHAPSAGFGNEDRYPDFVDKCGVLIVRLARNHPLPDGNKRVSWVSLRLFIELNAWRWIATLSIDDAEQYVLAIAAGNTNEKAAAEWLRDRIEPNPEGAGEA